MTLTTQTAAQDDVRDGRPLYLRIAATLRAEIDTGDQAPGSWIPSIADLGKRFSASQLTVRRALGLLEDEGRISVRQGIGTWVLDRQPDELDPLLAEASRIRDLATSLIGRIETMRQSRAPGGGTP